MAWLNSGSGPQTGTDAVVLKDSSDSNCTVPEEELIERSGILLEQTVLARTNCAQLDLVRSLSCYGMQLRDVSVAARLVSCEMISMVSNELTSLAPFASCHALVELFLRRNAIADPAELLHLSRLRWLRTLWLSQNPIAARADYRRLVRSAAPQLQQLDNAALDDESEAGQAAASASPAGAAPQTLWEPAPPTSPFRERWVEEEEEAESSVEEPLFSDEEQKAELGWCGAEAAGGATGVAEAENEQSAAEVLSVGFIRICLYIYIYIHLYIYIIYIYIYIHIYICIYVYVYLYMSISLYIYIYMYKCIHICLCIYIYISVYLYIYIYTSTYSYIYI